MGLFRRDKTLPSPNPRNVFWAMDESTLTLADAKTHFLVSGSTGSGKTTVLRLLMQSVLPKIKAQIPNMRALVYDPKREVVPIIAAMHPKAPIRILNPFDERTCAWDLAADITTPQHANAVASILIPEESNATQRFFSDAARSLLASVMSAFALGVPERTWTLRDVILAMRSPERLRAVVTLHRSTLDRAKPYLDDERPLPSILSTAATRLDPLEVVAAYWERAIAQKRTLPLTKWLSEESILVLGASPANRASLDPINLAMFKRVTDLLLDQPNDETRYTWLFLDEVREAGKLDGLSSVLNQGRSKGVCVAIGFQDIEGLQHVYGEKNAGELCGQCAHSLFLRTNSHKTAEWFESHFGQSLLLVPEEAYGKSHGPDGSSRTYNVSYRRTVENLAYGSELMAIPPTGPKFGLTGFYDLPGRPLQKVHTPWADIAARLPTTAQLDEISKVHPSTMDWKGLTAHDQLLRPWDLHDYARLHLSITVKTPAQLLALLPTREGLTRRR